MIPIKRLKALIEGIETGQIIVDEYSVEYPTQLISIDGEDLEPRYTGECIESIRWRNIKKFKEVNSERAAV